MSRTAMLVFFAAAGLLLAPAPSVSSMAAPAQPAATDVFDLDFPGGTVADFVAAIHRVRKDANIVTMPEAAAVPMPAMQLRAVSLDAAMSLLDGREATVGSQWVQTSLGSYPQSPASHLSVYSIQASTSQQPLTTQVYSVVDLLDSDLSSDDMMTAIETGVELLTESHGEPQVRFHPQTGILIVRGHPAQVEVVRNVLDQLMDGVQIQRRKARDKVEVQQARENAQRQAAKAAELEDQLRGSKAMIIELDARNSVLQDELARTRGRIDGMENERQELLSRLSTITIQLETLKRERASGAPQND